MTERPPPSPPGTRRPALAAAPRRSCVALGLVLCLGVALGSSLDALARSAEAPPGFRVVVHPENPESFTTREQLSDAFLKKATRWPRGEPLRPVDLRFGSPVREAFSQSILQRSAAAVRNYWQQRIFTGRGVPPPEVGTDADVIRYVQQHVGGIGYVSTTADPGTVKVLPIR